MWVPMVNFTPPLCHHVHDLMTGATTAPCSSASGDDRPCAEAAERALVAALGVLDPLDPLVRGADGEHERGAPIAARPISAALHRHALAEQDDQRRRRPPG